MSVPLIQQVRVGAYVLSKRLKRTKRYPLVLMLEPLFRCNLACPGCVKRSTVSGGRCLLTNS